MKNTKKNKYEFWQAKYEYYKLILIWVVIAASAASVLYFVSDCYMLGGYTMITFFPRMTIVIPVLIFLILVRKYDSYKVVVPMAYVVAHGIMWCTIWSNTFLDDLSFAAEGFVIINYVFLAMGIATPIHMAIIAHALLLVDIAVANIFIDYPEFNMMMLMGIPSFLGICAYNIAVEKSFKDRYMLQKKLEENLTRDSLTGIFNRKVMNGLVDENKRFVTESEHVSVIMFDLDHFKKINDTYGHDLGDKVLVGVCDEVRSYLSEEDVFIRWGGEEFIIITYNPVQHAVELAERICAGIAAAQLAVPKVTISMGVSEYHWNYERAIKRADEALYTAKEQGRNRVVLSQQGV